MTEASMLAMTAGHTLAELERRTGFDRDTLRVVLADEIRAGRVDRDDAGRHRLNVDAFDPRTFEALRRITLNRENVR